MTWNYRIFRTDHPEGPSFSIREAYYDDQGKMWAVTSDDIPPRGDTADDLISVLAQMLSDAKKSKAVILDKDTEFDGKSPSIDDTDSDNPGL